MRPRSNQILHEQQERVSQIHHALRSAVQTRLTGILPDHTQATKQPTCAVLFSGGLDCTLVARLIHDFLPLDQPLDLLNVAFENRRIQNNNAQTPHFGANCHQESIYERCPDRITARKSHGELQQVYPRRAWRLITIDVSYAEMLSHRRRVIGLMHPHDTEMDLSITLALYFAARGLGTTHINGESSITYQSSARILFSGLGADELFGGYGRHLVAWKRSGDAGLADELALDFDRIGHRNLGRDDRVIADWGKEVRYPFLDEAFVRVALQMPVWAKCDFAGCLEMGKKPYNAEANKDEIVEMTDRSLDLDPAKGLLRALAVQYGLVRVAREKKRAIQFGARTAKMHDGKTKGTSKIEVSERDIQ